MQFWLWLIVLLYPNYHVIFSAAARPTTLDASPFSPSAATATTGATTTIYRQCRTYKGTPRPRSRSHSSATADKEDSVEDCADNSKAEEGELGMENPDRVENSMDNDTSEQVFFVQFLSVLKLFYCKYSEIRSSAR